MRWIKHLTLAHADQEMGLVLEELGAVAYGIWWLVLEDIAAPMEPGKFEPTAVHSLSKWAQICHCPPRIFTKTAQSLHAKGLFELEISSKLVRITVRNLLKYKDEYSKKSGVEQTKTESRQKADTDQNRRTDAGCSCPVGSAATFPVVRLNPPEEKLPEKQAAAILSQERVVGMRSELQGYMTVDGRPEPPPPDDGIVLNCLDAVGATPINEVHQFLRFLRNKNDQGPCHANGPRKYAWFPVVLQRNFNGGRARDSPPSTDRKPVISVEEKDFLLRDFDYAERLRRTG